MKFLEDDKLAQLTSDLTDAYVLSGPGGSRTLTGGSGGGGGGGGGGESGYYSNGTGYGGGLGSRVINGRIEAYTMKRAGTDKKYAHVLGEKYLAEIEGRETEMAKFQRSLFGIGGDDSDDGGEGTKGGGRRRAGSLGSLPSLPPWKVEGRNNSGSGAAASSAGAAADALADVPAEGAEDTIKGEEDGDDGEDKQPRLTGGKSKPGGSRAGRSGRSQSVDLGGVSKAQQLRGATVSVAGRAASAGGASGTGGALPSILKQPTRPSTSRPRHRSSSWGSSPPTAAAGAAPRSLGGYFTNSSLGDFHEMGTRRLMTDLILTLNASFPDYDFSNVRPSHFVKVPSPTVAINRTNERLSEFAATSNCGTGMGGAGGMSGGGGSHHTNPYAGTTTTIDGSVFLQRLWSAIDDVIVLADSDVYSYVPPVTDGDDDPLGFLTQTLAGYDEDGCGHAAMTTSVPSSAGGGVGGGGTAMNHGMGGGHHGQGIMATGDEGGGHGHSVQVDQSGATVFTASVPLWTFNYFIVNKSLKRIVLFACVQTMRNEVVTDGMDDDDDDGIRMGISGGGMGMRMGRGGGGGGVGDEKPSPDRFRSDNEDEEIEGMVEDGDEDNGALGSRIGAVGGDSSRGGGGGGSASGYYSVSSTDAASDAEYDKFDTGALAEDVSRPPTPISPRAVKT